MIRFDFRLKKGKFADSTIQPSAQEALMSKHARSLWKSRYLLLALNLLWAFPAAAQDTSTPKTAGEVYKNIQVLKDLPAPQLMEVMHSFSKALAVNCSFCHVEGAFEKDDNHHKVIARKMILMATQINTDNFHGEQRVTCWTCHRGAEHPEAKPPQE
jgi:hypothetical protein